MDEGSDRRARRFSTSGDRVIFDSRPPNPLQSTSLSPKVTVENDALLSAIGRVLRERGAFDIARLEPACARRRVSARARAAGCPDLSSYLVVLERDPSEIDRLRRA